MAEKRTAKDILKDVYGYKVGYEGQLAAGNPNYAQNHYDAQSLYDELKALDPSLAAMASGQNARELKAYLDELEPAKTDYTPSETFSASADTFLKRGNDVSLNIDTMYFDPDYGKEVKDSYVRYGTKKSGDAAQGVAADNGGNLDSFANFNRDATDMAYRVAGDNAVQRMREGYAQGQTQFFNAWGGAVNTNNANFGNYDATVRGVESTERINNANIGAKKYEIDKNYALGLDTNAKNYDLGKYSADKTLAGKQVDANADIRSALITKGGTSGTSGVVVGADKDILHSIYKYGALTEQGAYNYLKQQGYSDADAKGYAKAYADALKVDEYGDNKFTNPDSVLYYDSAKATTALNPNFDKYLNGRQHTYASAETYNVDERLGPDPSTEEVTTAIVELIGKGLIGDAKMLAENRGYDSTGVDEIVDAIK